MLPLDSPRWATLRQRGGPPAGAVASLLHRLASPNHHFLDKQAAWHLLRVGLLDSYRVYEASYAAVPHLERISRSGGMIAVWEYIGLVAEIEACRASGLGEAVPEDIAPGYFATIGELPRMVYECRSEKLGEAAAGVLAGALVISLGQPKLGMGVIHFASQLQHCRGKVTCEACGEQYAPSGYKAMSEE